MSMQRRASMMAAGERLAAGGVSRGRYHRSDDAYEAGIGRTAAAAGGGVIHVGVRRPGAGSLRTSALWTIYIPLSTKEVNSGVTASSSRNIASTAGVRVTTCAVSEVKRETALFAEFV